MGYSAGTPYACACAQALPQKVKGLTLVGAIAPPEVTDYSKSMPMYFKFAWWAAGNSPFILSQAVNMTASEMVKNPVGAIEEDMKRYSAVDLKTFSEDETIRRLFVESALEMYSRDDCVKAEGRAYQLYARNWGFSLKEITCPTFLYGGSEDRATTQHLGDYIAATIPNCTASFIDGKGHLGFFEFFPDALQNLMRSSATDKIEKKGKAEKSASKTKSNEKKRKESKGKQDEDGEDEKAGDSNKAAKEKKKKETEEKGDGNEEESSE